MEMTPSPVQPVSERDQRKQEQAHADRTRARKHTLAKGAKLLGIICIVAAVLGGLVLLAEGQEHLTQPNPTINEVTAIDHTVGNPDATVTVIEYADFQCPACRSYAPVFHQMAEDYGDRVLFVYRYYPLKTLHPNAVVAARAAEAAYLQGKFWEMHASLFAEQDTWAGLSNPTDTFVSMAETLGMDGAKFRSDMNSKEVKERVEADYRSGLSTVTGTPTFFVNGEELQDNPRGIEAFEQLLDSRLGTTE